MKSILLLLLGMFLSVMTVHGQTPTYYNGIYYDAGTTVPGACTNPALFYNTTNNSEYMCGKDNKYHQVVTPDGTITIFGTQSFTTPGTSTFTPPVGVNRVWVQVWGGAGGGAGGNNAASAGSGGSGGGYAEGWCAVTPGTGVTVTVGAGGALGAANAVGGSGGNSSFGSCLTATGAAAQGSISTNTAGGIDNRMAAIAAISSVSYPLLSMKSAITSNPCSGWTYVGGASVIMTLLDSSGGCGALPPSVDGAGFGAGHAYKAGGGGGSGAFCAATTRIGGPGGLSALGGAGGTGDGCTNGTPNGTCTAGTQPGGGGGGGAANATLKSAGCAGAPGQVNVTW